MPEMGEQFYQGFALPSLREFLHSVESDIVNAGYRWSPDDRNIEVLLKFLQSTYESLSGEHVMPFQEGHVEEESTLRQVRARSSAIVAHELKKFILAKVTQRVETDYLSSLSEFVSPGHPLDIFTLNYDAVVEQFSKAAGVPCTDGFDKRGRWHPESYFLAREGIRLWKLHGSADWVLDPSGWPRQSQAPGTWRRHLRSEHTASATAEAALVWPAAEKQLANAQLLLHSAFRRILTECHVLIAIGYRFADDHIRAAILDAMEINQKLAVLVLCGSRKSSDEAKSELLRTSHSCESRVEVVEPGYVPAAFASGALRLTVSRLSAQPNISMPQRQRPSGSRQNEILCLGDFSAVASAGENLILTAGNPRTRLLRLNPSTGQLNVLQSWRGWARGLAVVGNQAVVADCARGGWKAGWGLPWLVDLETGTTTNLLDSSLLNFGQAAYKTARYRSGLGAAADFLDYGMLSWPTSADPVPAGKTVLTTEARRVIVLDLHRRTAQPISNAQFFNLAVVRCVSAERCILLEHVLRREGVLWDFDYRANRLTPILAGIQNATGLVLSPDGTEALISQGDDAPNGKIWRLDLRRKTTTVLQGGLHRPGAMCVLNNSELAVATAGALIRITL
ncbi:MAG: hypothetical protein QOH88_1804 [Verrucomicrobiota bacterium]|jgi:hypothetical protein